LTYLSGSTTETLSENTVLRISEIQSMNQNTIAEELDRAFQPDQTQPPAANRQTRLLRLSEPVNISLEQNGTPIGLDQYGRLTSAVQAGIVTLTLAMAPDYSVIGFNINETSKQANPLKDYGTPETGSVYRQRVVLERTQDGRNLKTNRDANCIRWVEVTERIVNENGESGMVVKMFLACLQRQKGPFFLIFQEMFSEEIIVWKGELRIPGCRRIKMWAEVAKFLESHLAPMIGQWNFREREDVEATTDQTDDEIAATLGENEGVIKWYSKRMGKGPAITKMGLARVSWQDIEEVRPDGFRYFMKGDKVRFHQILQTNTEQALKSQRPTEFKWELTGVVLA